MLQMMEQPEPAPGPGQVLVQVVSAGVNFADLLSVRGTYAQAPPPPFIPGLEVAGYELPSRRPVLALLPSGGYAELVAADRRFVFEADGMDLARSGGSLLVSLTAYIGLTEVARMREGETVAVLAGAGGLGSAAIQTARALGAGGVIAVASTEAKRSFARDRGADLALSYEEPLPPVDIVSHAPARHVIWRAAADPGLCGPAPAQRRDSGLQFWRPARSRSRAGGSDRAGRRGVDPQGPPAAAGGADVSPRGGGTGPPAPRKSADHGQAAAGGLSLDF